MPCTGQTDLFVWVLRRFYVSLVVLFKKKKKKILEVRLFCKVLPLNQSPTISVRQHCKIGIKLSSMDYTICELFVHFDGFFFFFLKCQGINLNVTKISCFTATPFSGNIQVSKLVFQPQPLLRFPQDAKNPICSLSSQLPKSHFHFGNCSHLCFSLPKLSLVW